MAELARGWVITIGIVLGLAVGWFGRGWWDGSSVSIGDAAKDSQQFVTAATQATTRIQSAEGKANVQRERTRARIDRDESDKSCPPGLGPVSPDMEQRLRAAFGPPKG